MNKLIRLALILFAPFTFAGDNDIYITQSGTGLTMNIDQIGDTNKVGTSQTRADFDYAATGDSNVLLLTQGAAATATAGNQDIVVAGTSNNINATCEVVGCINNWNVDGDSNDIDTTQTGNADHAITAVVTGSTNNIDIDQTNSTGSVSGVVVITSTTSNGTIDIDQCTSGC